jgi:hypothetical protein
LKFRVYLGPDHLPAPSEVPTTDRTRKTVRQATGRSSKRAVTPPPPSPVTPAAGFPAPTPMGVPRPVPVSASGDDALEIIEEDTDDSGWRKLMTSHKDEDILIDLE